MQGAIPLLQPNALVTWCLIKCRDEMFIFIVYLTKLYHRRDSVEYDVDK
jgi:hypothetical protein